MENFLNRLNRNPYAPIDSASITRVDELGNGYDDWNNLIAPKFEAPQQTWGETALGVATAPARLATALVGSLSPYGADGWQVPPVAQEGWNALTAVGDAYNYGMTDDEINSRALGMAGFMMGGGGLAAKPTLKAAAAPAPRAATAQSSLRLLLDEAGDSLPSKAPWESPQRYAYEIQSGAGDDIGWLSMALDPTGKTAFVDHVAMSNRDAGGLKGSRDLFRTIKQQHPDLESIYGYRMRNGEATPDDKMQMFDLTRLHSNASKEGAVPALASALDMSPEARLARAKEMGFDTDRTLYHGTDKEFDAFAPSRDGSLGSGVYLTPSEAYAGKYGQNILETYVRGNILDETDVPASVSRGLSGPWKRNRTPATAVADWARANGYDGIRQEGFQTVVFDPKNIRSVNAAFDPAKSDSANLLASNADSKPALLAGALGQEQDVPDWLLPFLQGM